MIVDDLLAYRRLRAPQRHGERWIDPPLTQSASLLDANRSQAAREGSRWQRQGWPEQIPAARAEMLDAARRYTGSYCDLDDAEEPGDGAPIIMSGHQPELYHAGVWVKNAVLSRLAEKHAGHGIHLLIDNDTVTRTGIHVPGGTPGEPHLEYEAYDQPGPPVPYEERPVLDEERFATFADRVAATIAPFVSRPLVRDLWKGPEPRTANLGRRLAQARHRLERAWGLRTREVPLGTVCRGATFHRWVACLLADLPQFRQVYNDSRESYRRVHRIRSHSHPVPRLAQHGDWLEAPFWAWRAPHVARRPLFARLHGTRIELSDGRDERLARLDGGSARSLATQLEELAAAGLKIRPRALTNTIYARLLLCDLFLHGIGGAKYDQLADQIMQSYFGVTPPQYLIVTGTAHLPIQRPGVQADDLRRITQHLRELEFHPESHVERDSRTRRLVEEKQRWIADTGSDRRRARHHAIVHINQQLQPFLQRQRRDLQDELARLARLRQIELLLGSREFSFCLFPEETLRPFLLDI